MSVSFPYRAQRWYPGSEVAGVAMSVPYLAGVPGKAFIQSPRGVVTPSPGDFIITLPTGELAALTPEVYEALTGRTETPANGPAEQSET